MKYDKKAVIVSAILGGTNYGQPYPSVEKVKNLTTYQPTLSSAVMALWGDLMESDDHQDMFEDEARGFHAQIMADPESAWVGYPAASALYDQAIA